MPAPAGPVTREWADSVTAAFHAEHRSLYGYDFAGDAEQQVEWVNLRVSGIGPITRPEIPQIAAAAGAPDIDERARTSVREVCFDADAGFVEAGVYWRPELLSGDRITGPAIIEEFGSTVPVHSGFRADVDSAGNLVITRTTTEAAQ